METEPRPTQPPKPRRQVEFGGDILDRAHDESSSTGRWVLGGLGVLVLVQAYLLSTAIQGLVVTVTVAVGVTFLFLGWLAKRKPVPALTAGLALYVGLITLDAVLAPQSATRGIFFKAIIVITLVGALSVQKALAGRK